MKKAKPIMVQGTMSGAGKSLLCAALCRIFAQDGYNTAPFKSQNMALNSFITKEGLEMGRAQVVQAQAAGVEPSVLMNPILLKPTTDVGSQVIVNGEVRGNMRAVDYFQYKKQLVPDIMRAYNTLAGQNDIIVIEGAGSPAEINLKTFDIVNMGMAKMAESPVLLVGDIDRGGVFAQLYGTVALLEEEERRMLKATVINKFRGDVSLLADGLDMLYDLVKVPCAGVVPYTYADIDDEDSLSERLTGNGRGGPIKIVVIRLPRMSNYTDFSVFERYGEITLKYVSRGEELENADLIMIPGTKNTISDLRWLRQSGLEAGIRKAVSRGIPLFGICGGYQMLGRTIRDPYGAEGEAGDEVCGMGYLDFHTVFGKEKVRRQICGSVDQVEGIFSGISMQPYEGYEIHMGESGQLPPIVNAGNVYGSYIHGLFDSDEISREMVASLCRAKGITFGQEMERGHFTEKEHSMEKGHFAEKDHFAESVRDYRNRQYDLLAGEVRNALDMNLIYKIIDEGIQG